MGGYGSLEVLGDKFLPKQSRLFDDEAESSEGREGGGKTLLSVIQAIRACETWSPPSTPPTLRPVTQVTCATSSLFAKSLFLSHMGTHRHMKVITFVCCVCYMRFVSCTDNVEAIEGDFCDTVELV